MDRNQILNDPETAMRYALSGLQSQVWTALPGIIQAVNLDAMTVDIQPSIKGVATSSNGDSSFVNMPLLLDCPIVFPSAGGFSLTLPIHPGDEVLIIISSRCIDAWWQNGGIQAPIELRMHDLSDGFAIPGPKSQPNVVSGISPDNAQLRTDDGTCFLEITPGGQINLMAPSGVNITGDLNVTGDVASTGNVVAMGQVTATNGGPAVNLTTHFHPGVTVGSGTTGDAEG